MHRPSRLFPESAPNERDESEVLARGLGPLHRRDRGNVDAASPAPLGEPGHLARWSAGLGDLRLAGLGELLAEELRPAAVRQPLDARVGDKARDRATDRGAHRWGSLAIASYSRPHRDDRWLSRR